MFNSTTRWSAIAVVLALVALSLTAGTAPAHAKTTISIGMPGGSAVHDPEILKRFEEQNPDIKVETIPMSWSSFFDKLALMLVTDTAPDVWYGEAGRALEWYNYRFIEDLGPYAHRDLDLDTYFFLDAAKDPKSGAWTGIPSDFQVTSLFYNTEHFQANGIAFPSDHWTTNDLVAAAKKLTLPGADEALRWGFNLQPGYITAGWMLWTKLLGGHVLDPTRTQSRLASPETVTTLRETGSLIHEKGISPPPGAPGYEPWEAARSFQDGRTSMMFNIYSWNRQLNSVGMDSYDVQVVPASPEGKRFTTAVPNVWVINAKSSEAKKEAAWRWIKFQIGEEAQTIRMASGAGVPVNRKVAFAFSRLPNPPENRRIYLDSYAFAGTLEENAVWEQYRRAVEKELQPFWAAEITAREAAIRADQQVRTILKKIS